jgi:hypothetical protein
MTAPSLERFDVLADGSDDAARQEGGHAGCDDHAIERPPQNDAVSVRAAVWYPLGVEGALFSEIEV